MPSGFTGAPRAAFAVIDDAENEGRKLFLHAKNNLAAPPQGLAFRLEQTIIPENIVASRVWWESEPVALTANQALAAEAAGEESRTARAEAAEFLSEILAHGPMPQKEVKAAAEGAGLAWATVRRAKGRIGVIAERKSIGASGAGQWVWTLPKPYKVLTEPQGAHLSDVSTLHERGHLADDGLDIPTFLRRT